MNILLAVARNLIRSFKTGFLFLARTVKPTTKLGYVFIAGLLIVAVLAFGYFSNTESVVEPDSNDTLQVVRVAPVASFSEDAAFSLIGRVASVNEAIVQSEAAGRVVSVNVSLGTSVAPGQVLVQLENSAQRAALLQAEGAYEAAIAASAQSDVGVDDANTAISAAQNNALNANRSAYTSANNVVISVLDDIFTNPSSGIPGVILNSANFIQLSKWRVELQTTLPLWQQAVTTALPENDLTALTETSLRNINFVLTMVDDVIAATINQNNQNVSIAGSSIELYRSRLTAARAQLLNDLNVLNNSITTIQTATDARRRAEIGSQNQGVSAANAQIKQAEGALLAVQSALAKTVVRSPIRGTVNKINIKVGDFLPGFTEVAQIVNTNALEVTVFVGEADRLRLAEGDAVRINGETEGVVTAIAPAIDPATRKYEVKIGTESKELSNGSTVTVSVASGAASTEKSTNVRIPITAIKFTDREGSIFVVVDGKLEAKPVTIGVIQGGSVEILDGISDSEVIVVDARGLVVGQRVEVVND